MRGWRGSSTKRDSRPNWLRDELPFITPVKRSYPYPRKMRSDKGDDWLILTGRSEKKMPWEHRRKKKSTLPRWLQ